MATHFRANRIYRVSPDNSLNKQKAKPATTNIRKRSSHTPELLCYIT